MDVETAEAVDALRTDISRVERKLEQVETSLSVKMDEHKRHTDVQFEDVRGDIRMIAGHLASVGERLVSLGEKVDSLKR